MSRRAARRDEAEPDIVKALRAAGASVEIIGDGDGRPDLMVGYRGNTFHLEVKNPLGPRGGKSGGGASRPGQGGDGVLTEAQRDWWAAWKGAPPVIVRTPAEALAAIGATDRDVKPANVPMDGIEATIARERSGVVSSALSALSALDDMPQICLLRCRCGYEFIGRVGGGVYPPPHFANESDRRNRLLCAEVDLSQVKVAPPGSSS